MYTSIANLGMTCALDVAGLGITAVLIELFTGRASVRPYIAGSQGNPE